MSSKQGHLLVASPRLADPNFFRAVVLILQHDKHGALGVVLNRPLDVTIQAAWERVDETPCRVEGAIYQGGPCDGPLMAVHTNPTLSQARVMSGIYYTTERQAIQQLVAENSGPMKFFAGYAGWGAGQLETEMEDGGWLLSPGSGALIFGDDDPWRGLLRAIQRSHAPPWAEPGRMPDDPSVN